MNLLKVIHDVFEPFMDDEKRPLNTLEVSNLWLYLVSGENTMRNDEVAYNLAQDSDLKQILKDVKESIHQPIAKEIRQLLQEEGVPLPPATSEKPIGDYKDIPEGAKLNDEEIASLTFYNLLLGINYASRGLTEAIRADVGLLFIKYFVKKVTLSLSLKQLMEKRGWLHVPPDYKG